MDITKLKIRDMRKMLDSGEISASELTQGYIERIKKYDGNVKSYITVTEENALESANAAQEKIKAGNAAPLCPGCTRLWCGITRKRTAPFGAVRCIMRRNHTWYSIG